MWIAITRDVSPALAACELSFVERSAIDVQRAQAQHDGYCRALESLGCEVIRLPAEAAFPDSVFVEDVALVFDEVGGDHAGQRGQVETGVEPGLGDLDLPGGRFHASALCRLRAADGRTGVGWLESTGAAGAVGA